MKIFAILFAIVLCAVPLPPANLSPDWTEEEVFGTKKKQKGQKYLPRT